MLMQISSDLAFKPHDVVTSRLYDGKWVNEVSA